jgi:hypothetical protein
MPVVYPRLLAERPPESAAGLPQALLRLTVVTLPGGAQRAVETPRLGRGSVSAMARI